MPKLAKKALTAVALKTIGRPRSGQKEIADGVVRGLRFRVTSANTRSYILSYRVKGRLTRRVIGYYPKMDLAEARRLAQEIRDGGHPVEVLGIEEPEEPELTFGQLAESYIARGMIHRTGIRAGQPHASAVDTERLIRKEILPTWGDFEVNTLTKKDATVLTDAIIDRGAPQTANAVHRTYHAIINWAVRRGEVDANPFSLMGAPSPTVERTRLLAPDEIKAIWNACYMMGYPFGPFYRLLLLTGQRRDEVSGLWWRELDLRDRIWRIPGERTKNGLPHEVPLSSLVMQEIENLPRFKVSDYVFTTTDGERPVSGFSRSKRRLDRYSGVKDWRGHDLRRCVRTGMAELGVPEIVAERVLNHAERNVLVRTYNRYSYLDEKRDALERWAGHVRDIVSPPPENVVRMEQV
jgi:integrase